MGAGLGLGSLLGWPAGQSLFFGGVIAISSTMVILKTLLDRREVGAAHGRVLLSMLIVQDVIAVLLMVLLPKLASGAETGLGDLGRTLAVAAAFIAAVMILGARVVPRLMARIQQNGSSELFLLTAVALALGTAALSGLLGLSPALGAFMAGVLLTETDFHHHVIAEIVPMRNLFGTLFFVSVGMLIDPFFVASHWLTVFGIVLFIVCVKAVATAVAVAPFRLGVRPTVFAVLGMVQIGEFSYVLAQGGRGAGVISDDLYSQILAASVMTIILTPAAFAVAPAVERQVLRMAGVTRGLSGGRQPALGQVEVAEHAIVVGGGRVGGRVAAALQGVGLPVLVLDQDPVVVQRLKAEGISTIWGDASRPAILASAHPERARLLVAALPDAKSTEIVVAEARRANAAVPILARAARQEDVASLMTAGVTAAISPEEAGATLLVEQCARALDLPAAELLELDVEEGLEHPGSPPRAEYV
jgi:CPA2 family monovalent cation:H+ antiporter-2